MHPGCSPADEQPAGAAECNAVRFQAPGHSQRDCQCGDQQSGPAVGIQSDTRVQRLWHTRRGVHHRSAVHLGNYQTPADHHRHCRRICACRYAKTTKTTVGRKLLCFAIVTSGYIAWTCWMRRRRRQRYLQPAVNAPVVMAVQEPPRKSQRGSGAGRVHTCNVLHTNILCAVFCTGRMRGSSGSSGSSGRHARRIAAVA